MAALMVPQVLSFVQVEFPAAERARVRGVRHDVSRSAV
jgi:hypothetical protein